MAIYLLVYEDDGLERVAAHSVVVETSGALSFLDANHNVLFSLASGNWKRVRQETEKAKEGGLDGEVSIDSQAYVQRCRPSYRNSGGRLDSR